MHILWSFLLAVNVCFCYHTILFNTKKDLRLALLQKTKKISIISKDQQEATAIGYVYNGSLICWADATLEQIECASFNGNGAVNRTTYAKGGVPSPDGLACDWLTKKLYWTDNESKRIEVVSLENKYRKVLFWQDLDQPRGIAVDSLAGLMFWTDWGEIPKIERASMNGDLNSRKIIIDKDIYWPNSVSLDVHAKQLYWIDGKLFFIEVTDYDGNERTKLIDRGLEYPFALSIASDKIYWTDWKTYSIYSINRHGDNEPNEVIRFTDSPIYDIEVYDPAHQPYNWTPCEQNNGGCSHLCLLSSGPQHYSCACPTGIRLADEKTCAGQVDNFILLVQRSEISLISLDTPDHSYTELPLRGIKNSIGIDYDPVEEYFYWTDMVQRNIRRAKLDGSHQETVVWTDVLSPDGIAIDWIARNFYWCDAHANRIEVARLNTSYRKAVIFDDLEDPRALVVYPQQGWLFWSDWNELKPKIERSDLDGSNRLVLVRNDILWPNGLALDFERRKLYFGDAKTDRIEVVNMDGTDRREVIGDNLAHIFSISLLGDQLYWTDWSRRSLETANIHRTQERSVVVDQLSDLMGLKAVSRYPPPGTTPCAKNNGDCDQFCLNRPSNKYVCACQIEYELAADQRKCVLPNTYLVLYAGNKVRRISTSTENSNSELVPVSGAKAISAADVSVADHRLYWADNRLHAINRAFLNGSRAEKIVSFGVHSPESVAIDWMSSNLYWADVGLRRIEVTKLNGQYRRTLFWNNLKEPRNLALNPHDGYMFWSEWGGDSGSIMKGSMDGATKVAILAPTNRVNGLTIDYTQKLLYWTQGANDRGTIEFCDSNGQNRQVLVQLHSIPQSIALNRDNFFWTKWNDSSVVQMQRQPDAYKHTLYTHSGPVSDLRMVDTDKLDAGSNECSVNNGGCKYLCLVRPGPTSYTPDTQCTCPTHYVMRDGICYPPVNFLLYSLRNAVYRLSINTHDCPDSPLAISGLKAVRAIEYDASTKHIYWIDGKMSAVKRNIENGSQSVTVVNGAQKKNDHYSHLFDIALEPFSKLLFWTCSVSNTINATRLNNSSVGCVFEGKRGEKPRYLALFPEKGLIFWTDVGANPRIVQSRLNGDKQVTIDTNGQTVDTVTVDRRTNLLYFACSGRLFQYDLVERDKRLLLTSSSKKIFSLAAIRAFLYWVDRDAQRIERIDVSGNGYSDRATVVEQLAQVTDLIAVDASNSVSALHPCSSVFNHGNCSHLCLPSADRVDEVECGCPVGLELGDDRQTCVDSPLRTLHEQITCKLDRSGMVCDGKADCADGSDEFNCCTAEYSGVGLAYFQCKTSGCVPNAYVCDGSENCADGSDESASVCGGNVRVSFKTDNYVEDSKSVQFTIAFLILIGLAVVGLYFCFKRRFKQTPVGDHDGAAMRPLALALNVCPQVVNAKSPLSLTTNGNGDGSTGSYERTTGVSSSTSMIHCPLNPPPSPTTTTMQQDECCCSLYAGPTPTPCSTDVCDESDSTTTYRTEDMYVRYQDGRNGSATYQRRMPDKTHRHRQRRQPRFQQHSGYDYQDVPYSPYRSDGTDYELAPPPPTPYTSNPPSPSSSVYFRPSTIPPPPPTPINSLPDQSN